MRLQAKTITRFLVIIGVMLSLHTIFGSSNGEGDLVTEYEGGIGGIWQDVEYNDGHLFVVHVQGLRISDTD